MDSQPQENIDFHRHALPMTDGEEEVLHETPQIVHQSQKAVDRQRHPSTGILANPAPTPNQQPPTQAS